jgi:hypothetical protein
MVEVYANTDGYQHENANHGGGAQQIETAVVGEQIADGCPKALTAESCGLIYGVHYCFI